MIMIHRLTFYTLARSRKKSADLICTKGLLIRVFYCRNKLTASLLHSTDILFYFALRLENSSRLKRDKKAYNNFLTSKTIILRGLHLAYCILITLILALPNLEKIRFRLCHFFSYKALASIKNGLLLLFSASELGTSGIDNVARRLFLLDNAFKKGHGDL